MDDLLTSDFEFLVVTDGSGKWQDHTGGACAAVVDRAHLVKFTVLAQSSTTVMRMEFQALLEGLNLVTNHPDFYPGARVRWLCDNKSLVEGVQERNTPSTNHDLWLLYDYYRSVIDITAGHISRDNNNLLHNLCDLHASTLREVLADYVENNINFDLNNK